MNIYQLPALNNENLFEDSICDLFDSLEKTKTFKKFGRKGHNQKGIDLFSSEKNIAIQCKKKDLSRQDILLKKELLNDIEKDLKTLLNNDLKIKIDTLYFTSTFKDNPEIDEYCEILKDEFNTDFEIIYFGWDTLQSKFLEYNNLIQKYWPNFVLKNDNKELKIKRKLHLKDKISDDFSDWINYKPQNRKKRSRMILRSYDSEQYPNTNEPDKFGEYSWFASEIKSLYHDGMEFITDSVTIQVFDDNSWNFPGKNKKTSGKLINVVKVGQINFADIIGYDLKGDEYYNCPHIYCKFRFKGTPFENYYFQHLEKSYLKFEYENMRV